MDVSETVVGVCIGSTSGIEKR